MSVIDPLRKPSERSEGEDHQAYFPAIELNTEKSLHQYIKTGSVSFDGLFNGNGIETQAITELIGSPGTGKTQLCHQLCVMIQKLNPQNKAIYIDTQGKFRPERICEIAIANDIDPKKVLHNIKLARVLNSARQKSILQDCYSEIEKDCQIRLLIMDSITALYRSEYSRRYELSKKQHDLNKIMNLLIKIARDNVAVVITNQVHGSSNSSTNAVGVPTGGNIMALMSTFRIQLRRGSNKRYANLIKSPTYSQKKITFEIGKEGIIDYNKLNVLYNVQTDSQRQRGEGV
jgi:DNA repair protein RadA